MICFLASTLPRCFVVTVASIFQFLFDALLSISVFAFFLLLLVVAELALETGTASVMNPKNFWIEMLPPELATAIVACVRPYILRMVTPLSASFAH